MTKFYGCVDSFSVHVLIFGVLVRLCWVHFRKRLKHESIVGELGTAPEDRLSTGSNANLEVDNITVFDLSSHPQYGNLLVRKQSEVAQLLGLNVAAFNSKFKAQYPTMRWPCRLYMSLSRLLEKTAAAYEAGVIDEDVRRARVEWIESEMAALVEGPVLLNLDSSS